jgi:hypothetical protein
VSVSVASDRVSVIELSGRSQPGSNEPQSSENFSFLVQKLVKWPQVPLEGLGYVSGCVVKSILKGPSFFLNRRRASWFMNWIKYG